MERRQAKRLDVLWQLNVEILSRPMPVSVSDISATGFSVETTTPFEEGEVHEFRFSLDGGSSATIQAEAAHGVANDRVGELQLYLTGFKFVELDTEQKQELKALLTQIQQYLALA
ncbi:MAG TPA: PilZ domain-containing protein [Vicinamibacterales bacterium]|nr:PilZ domain-containing protein [Vicinamibacterales bacterium]